MFSVLDIGKRDLHKNQIFDAWQKILAVQAHKIEWLVCCFYVGKMPVTLFLQFA